MSAGLWMLGSGLGTLGYLGLIVACCLPLWRVTAFIGSNIVTAQTVWEGLWMNCVVQSTGQMQCKAYDSMLALSSELQASRAILIIALFVALVAIVTSIAGCECINLLAEGSATKSRVATAAGVIFLVAGVMSLIPPSWTAHVIITDFYNPLLSQGQKRELGASVFICWGAAVLLLIGGGLLCTPQPSPSGARAHYKAAPRARERDYV
ncbi:claudin-like protein ZF-A9 [Hoplias malabaricus]|uniref:claudin-like protein ZF-A9 n=1 Tax=Hoplias malabaricus TaxID=27720 RepID=UPI003462B725